MGQDEGLQYTAAYMIKPINIGPLFSRPAWVLDLGWMAWDGMLHWAEMGKKWDLFSIFRFSLSLGFGFQDGWMNEWVVGCALNRMVKEMGKEGWRPQLSAYLLLFFFLHSMLAGSICLFSPIHPYRFVFSFLPSTSSLHFASYSVLSFSCESAGDGIAFDRYLPFFYP